MDGPNLTELNKCEHLRVSSNRTNTHIVKYCKDCGYVLNKRIRSIGE